jgi:hypothetical protein
VYLISKPSFHPRFDALGHLILTRQVIQTRERDKYIGISTGVGDIASLAFNLEYKAHD